MPRNTANVNEPSAQSPRDSARKGLEMNPESPAMAVRSGQQLLANTATLPVLGTQCHTPTTAWGELSCGHYLDSPGCRILAWQNGTQGADHDTINSTINSQLI